MNVVSGNCAGTFSGFLAQLAWMETAEKNPDVNLALHTRNKTHYPGSSYSNYRWFNSADCNNIDEVVGDNILFDFFEPNEYMTREYPDEFTYFETYPADVKDQFSNYPEDTLKYDGRGSKKEQYSDTEFFNKTRIALNNQWNKFTFTDRMKNLVAEEQKLIEGKKVMTLMLRHSEHYAGATKGYKLGGPAVMENAIRCVKERIDDYDAILLTTLIQPFVDQFRDMFGDRLITTNRDRFPIDIDWKGGRYTQEPMTNAEYDTEYQNAFLDVILTSKTDLAIGSSSNMFLASMCMNPKLKYEMFVIADGC